MRVHVKYLLRQIIPPVLIRLLRRIHGHPLTFSGDYACWDDAMAHATGYSADVIFRRVVLGTQKVLAGEAAYERDSVVFDHVQYSWPLLAALLQVAAERRSLCVIDFGGSLGSTWRQNRGFLTRLNIPLRWCIVEQEKFVSLGREEFSDETLEFHYTIADGAKDGVDVVLFCSSLCYLPDPEPFLNAAFETQSPFLIIDRLPLIAGDKDRIALQRVREPIYEASYPIRFFSQSKLLSERLRHWRLIEKWESELQPDPRTKYFGLFMERR